MWTTEGVWWTGWLISEFPSAGISHCPSLRDVRSDVPCIEKSRHTSGSLALTHTLSPHARIRTPSTSCSRRTGWAHWAEEFRVTFVNDAARFGAPSRRRRRRLAEGAAQQSPALASSPGDHDVRVSPRLTHSLGIIACRQGADRGSRPR